MGRSKRVKAHHGQEESNAINDSKLHAPPWKWLPTVHLFPPFKKRGGQVDLVGEGAGALSSVLCGIFEARGGFTPRQTQHAGFFAWAEEES